MSKNFKIVEPEFVTKAKQSTVAAVEARFAREEARKRKVAQCARAKSYIVWIVLLVLAAAGGAYLLYRHCGSASGGIKMRVHEDSEARVFARAVRLVAMSGTSVSALKNGLPGAMIGLMGGPFREGLQSGRKKFDKFFT